MKRIIAILILLAMATSIALAANVKFTGSCHVYKKAGSGKTATVIRKGSVAKKVAKSGGWVQIQLTDGKKTKVWVRGRYVRDTKEDGLINYAAGGYGLSGEAGGKAEPVKNRTAVAKWKCNLRDKPSMSGKSIATVPKGAKLKLLGQKKPDSRGVYWYKASYRGKTGWVSNGIDE